MKTSTHLIGFVLLISHVLISDLRGEENNVLLLGTGVNFGNMLEAPSEGEWGL